MRQRNHTSRGMVHGRLIGVGLAISLTVLLAPVHLPAQPPAPSQRVLAAQELLEVEAKIREIEQAALQADPDYTAAVKQLADAESAWSEHRAAFEARRNADPKYQNLLSQIETLRLENDAKQQAARQARLDHQSAERSVRELRSRISKVRQQIDDLQAEIERYKKRAAALANADAERRYRDRDFANSRAHYYRKIADTNKQIGQLRQELRFVQEDAEDIPLSEAEAEREKAETEAKTAQQNLIRANRELQAVEARWESLFESDPQTMMLRMTLEQAQQETATAKENVLSSIQDPAYHNLLTRREELKQELGPS